MKGSLPKFTLVRLCIFLCLAPWPATAAERLFQETLPVAPTLEISLDSGLGTVTVMTWAQDSVQLRATARHANATVLEALILDIDQEADELEIEIDSRSPWQAYFGLGSRRSLEIDYEIIVPHRASLDLDGRNTSYFIDAPAGEIEIEARRSGRLSQAEGILEFERTRGNVEINITELSHIEIETYRGSVVANLVNARNYRLDAQVSRGELSVSGSTAEVHERRRSRSLQYTQGDGANVLEVEVSRGDLQLNFQN